MQTKRIDHIAIAVKDLALAVQTYQANFGLQQVKGGEVSSLGIRNALLQLGDAQIELITPLTEQGPVAEFLSQQEGGMYLLSLEVDELDAAVAELQDKGVPVTMAEGSEGKRMALVSPEATHGVRLQLLER